MKRGAALGVFCLLWLCLVAMGGLGGPSPVSVPEPSGNFAATIVDQSGTSSRVEKFSIDGRIALSGKLGIGQVSIDFEQINTIEFIVEQKEEKELKAKVVLTDGRPASLIVDKGLTCYGRLPYGNFTIGLEDVRSITLHGRVKD